MRLTTLSTYSLYCSCVSLTKQLIMRRILIIIGIIISGQIYGQQLKTTDFLTEITKHDISYLWTLSKFQAEDDTITVERQDPIGYIGENFQRFYIHIISAIQNPTNKLEYLIYGKTRVKSNVCSFQGKINIINSQIYNSIELPGIKQGYITGNYMFFEDSKMKGSGLLSGKFTTNFYFDKKGILKYDAIMFMADGYENNQFEGSWMSYKNNDKKNCCWGDYRIPNSRGLDCGTGEFMVNEEFIKNGWQTYVLTDSQKPGSDDVKKAIKEEERKWWLENEKTTKP